MGNVESHLVISCIPCGFLHEHASNIDDKFSGYESSTSTTDTPNKHPRNQITTDQNRNHNHVDDNHLEKEQNTQTENDHVNSLVSSSHFNSDPNLRSQSCSMERITKKSILKRTSSQGVLHNSASMPNLSSVNQFNNPRRTSIRFSSDKPSMVRIDSHKNLSRDERLSIYYDHDDMKIFIQSELKRRAKKGITSMSALAPNSDESDDDHLEF